MFFISDLFQGYFWLLQTQLAYFCFFYLENSVEVSSILKFFINWKWGIFCLIQALNMLVKEFCDKKTFIICQKENWKCKRGMQKLQASTVRSNFLK